MSDVRFWALAAALLIPLLVPAAQAEEPPVEDSSPQDSLVVLLIPAHRTTAEGADGSFLARLEHQGPEPIVVTLDAYVASGWGVRLTPAVVVARPHEATYVEIEVRAPDGFRGLEILTIESVWEQGRLLTLGRISVLSGSPDYVPREPPGEPEAVWLAPAGLALGTFSALGWALHDEPTRYRVVRRAARWLRSEADATTRESLFARIATEPGVSYGRLASGGPAGLRSTAVLSSLEASRRVVNRRDGRPQATTR
ncbi:MAG TPA: hypothetical protein VM681_06970, partial [Candidatus Thermoplasmatota archaeon]|nr:hypothetical protein [Candidatus Thermoplasmatota archaeon]